MGIFNKLKEPIFTKSIGSAQYKLEQLQAIDRNKLSDELKVKLEHEIKLINLGIQGENAIEFELKNSHMPMYILHDLYIENEGLSAQIDYLVITRKCNFVIECKNLFGNIEINNKGDFIRNIYWDKKWHKEGIYSPITQNQRHLDIIKHLRFKTKTNFITKALFESNFSKAYHSIIVLANPKTILNDRNASELIKSQVIRADALITHIKQIQKNSDYPEYNDSEMEKLAMFYMNNHIERDIDYTGKYFGETDNSLICPKCSAKMVLRTAKKGDNAGKQFWGCSMFPKCRNIINLDN